MVRMVLHWFLNAIALLVVSRLVHGFEVTGLGFAMIAVIVIGFLNATLGLLLKIIMLPLGILTFGVFFLIVNAFILKFASAFVPGFRVLTFSAAFWGALTLALLHLLFGFLFKSGREAARDRDYRIEG
jgi:putative membrane protein